MDKIPTGGLGSRSMPLKLLRARRLQHMGVESISDPEPNHIVLVGHPGVGKTMAAEHLANIMYDTGLIEAPRALGSSR
eukprot:COSAG02_NODE_4813_length_4949_cov_2.146598_7_plen_78_part_00